MSMEEIGILVVLILLVVGPKRLPEYAEQLGRLVRNVRQMATGATETIREELGDEIADFDFSKFDPRQYDPRRIVREALLDDIIAPPKPRKPRPKPVADGGPKVEKVAAAAVPSVAGAAAVTTDTAAVDTPMEQPLPPFDDEAT